MIPHGASCLPLANEFLGRHRRGRAVSAETTPAAASCRTPVGGAAPARSTWQRE